jgi:hypothetical protein
MGDLNPHYFKLPPLLHYVLFLLYAVYFALGRVLGHFPDADAFAALFFRDPTSFYLIGRLFAGAFLGTLSIYLAWRLGRKLYSDRAAVGGAFFLAVSFLHVRDSHYVVYDVPLTAGFLACFLALAGLLKRGSHRDYVVFGLLAGITTAAKYNGALVLLPFFLAHGLRVRKEGRSWTACAVDGKLFLALFAAGAAYFAGNPFSLLAFREFWQDFSIQAGAEAEVGFWHHLVYSLREGMGWPLLAAGLAGTAVTFFSFLPALFLRKEVTSPSLGGFVAAFFTVLWLSYIALYSQPYERYALPVLPFLCLAASGFLAWALEKLRMAGNPWVWVACALALALPQAVKSAYADMLFSRPDIRTIAKSWIEANIPSGSKIAMDYKLHQPALGFSENELHEKAAEAGGLHGEIQKKRLAVLFEEVRAGAPSYDLFFLDEQSSTNRPLFAKPTVPFSVTALKEKGIRYVLVTKYWCERRREGEGFLYEHPGFYEDLRREARLIQVFSPFRDRQRTCRPTYVWQTGAATESRDLFSRERFGDIIELFQLTNEAG